MAMIGLFTATLFTGFLMKIGTCQVVNINISRTDIVAVVDDRFVGITFDSMFIPTSVNFGGLNFSSPKVQLLARAISPTYVRVGGGLGDEITFDPTSHADKSPNLTYTRATWDRLNKFVQTVGWDMVFGLNALKRNGLEWDPSNAIALINYTIARNYTIAGFELGNEPQFFPGPLRGKILGGQLGRDFMKLKNILQSLPQFKSTLLVGADSVDIYSPSIFSEFFSGIGSIAVDRITFHQYYGYVGQATVDKCVDYRTMNALIQAINTVYKVVKQSNPTTPVWLGETSSFWGGGALGISNTYVAGFLWLDKLGVAAKYGIKCVMRQSFYGQNYSLIDMTFEPLPDYWLTLLYKRLVGNNVLNVTADGGNYLRVYAHCTNHKNPYGYPPGSVTVYYLNIHNDTSTTLISLPQFKDKVMLVYILSPATPGNLTDKYVSLNNKRLKLEGGVLPALEPVKTTGGYVITLAKTFGFIVIPDADLDLCKQ